MEQQNENCTMTPVCFLTEQEFSGEMVCCCHMEDLKESLTVSNCCKVEVYKEVIEGIIRVPAHKLDSGGAAFGFCLGKDRLFIIEEKAAIQSMWAVIKEKLDEPVSAALCLLEILETLSKDDILYLQYLEKEMGMIEDALMKGKELAFSREFLHFRRKLSELHYYYEQMIDIGETMQAEYGRREQEELRLEWQQYSNRMGRLHDYVNFLREYIIQLRDLYHTQMDDRQNRGINFLTIVTSLFLPLTLLTGWYGMNFEYMPEVSWRYGYVMIIGVAFIIIALELLYIKRKKILYISKG